MAPATAAQLSANRLRGASLRSAHYFLRTTMVLLSTAAKPPRPPPPPPTPPSGRTVAEAKRTKEEADAEAERQRQEFEEHRKRVGLGAPLALPALRGERVGRAAGPTCSWSTSPRRRAAHSSSKDATYARSPAPTAGAPPRTPSAEDCGGAGGRRPPILGGARQVPRGEAQPRGVRCVASSAFRRPRSSATPPTRSRRVAAARPGEPAALGADAPRRQVVDVDAARRHE